MLKGIGHIAFTISDLERSLDFYCNKLGLREAFRLDREGTPSPWIVYLQIAPGHFIELFPGAVGENNPSPVGYNHCCLLVDDMDATLTQLEERGLPISGTVTRGLDNNWQYWLTDPDGNRIELMEITQDSPHAAADKSWSTFTR